MHPKDLSQGSFTLPGEAGHEALTLRLARKWGADTIRDSDGTKLSPEILDSGYAIYSTLCLVRSIQPWVREHQDQLQQNFLLSRPVVAEGTKTRLPLLAGYYREQFRVNWKDSPARWWQVHDRTTGEILPKRSWSVEPRKGTLCLEGTVPGHTYTANFLAFRLWEEISMYNHLTNQWGDREHLAAVDPMQPAVQRQLLVFLKQWLREHSATSVVRFTSLFYNFSWFWGEDHCRQRDLYSDWGDYAMSVSPRALRLFESQYGYKLCAEDFVQGGRYNSTHNPPTSRYRDYMDFLHDFVLRFGKTCIERVHEAGKKAFVFYDDHWIGVEPNSPRFPEFGFDGLIKCVFNAFEVRLCGHAKGDCLREIRLHPYLFPTGLKGEPTFKEGGHPTLDAKQYWIDARRGLLRTRIDRIGLGGYLSLVEPFPDFQDYIALVAEEFRLIKSLHAEGGPWVAPFQVAILSAWGDLRAWTCSGHFAPGLVLYDVLESLAGLPFEPIFLSFEQLAKEGLPKGVKVVLNAGRAGSAWSGGEKWEVPAVEAVLTRFVATGGGLVGLGEPSERPDSIRRFKLAQVLGLDRDLGERLANGKYKYEAPVSPWAPHFLTRDLVPGTPLDFGVETSGLRVLDGTCTVLAERQGSPQLTVHAFGKGRAVYFSGFRYGALNTRLLHRALYWAASKEELWGTWLSSNPETEATYFPGAETLFVINNSTSEQCTGVDLASGGKLDLTLPAFGLFVYGKQELARDKLALNP